MIVTLGSIRGAPGVTSWSLLLAAAWPTVKTLERVVVEADPSGGVLGARYGWGVEPGAISLVSRLRRTTARPIALDRVARVVGHNVFVVPGPETGERARSIWRGETANAARQLADDPRTWIVDVGRLEEQSPTIGFVDHSALTVVVSTGRPEDLVQAPQRIATLRRRRADIGLLVTGACAYSVQHLVEFCSTTHVWHARDFDDIADAAGCALVESKARRRSRIWRQALEVATDLARVTSRPATSDRVGESVGAAP